MAGPLRLRHRVSGKTWRITDLDEHKLALKLVGASDGFMPEADDGKRQPAAARLIEKELPVSFENVGGDSIVFFMSSDVVLDPEDMP